MSDKKPVDGSLSAAGAALGKVGGRKGGPARAAALSAEERSAIARAGGLSKAAKAKSAKSKLKKKKKGDTK